MNRLAFSAFLIGTMISQVAGEIKPYKSVLSITRVAGSGHPGEHLYVINGLVTYRTLEELKRDLRSYPKGSTLTWSPGCMRMGNETQLDSEEHLGAFKAFCDSIGMTFIIVPSG